MEAKNDALSAIFAAVSDIIKNEYLGFYRKIEYEASKVVPGTSGMASDEIRNAFEHFAGVFELVSQILGNSQDPLEKLDERRDKALLEAARGRRHIAHAGCFWSRDALTFRRKALRTKIQTLEEIPLGINADEFDAELTQLENHTESLKPRLEALPTEPRYKVDLLVEDVKIIIALALEIFILTARYDKLLSKLASAT